jgi:hypothetical protein
MNSPEVASATGCAEPVPSTSLQSMGQVRTGAIASAPQLRQNSRAQTDPTSIASIMRHRIKGIGMHKADSQA